MIVSLLAFAVLLPILLVLRFMPVFRMQRQADVAAETGVGHRSEVSKGISWLLAGFWFVVGTIFLLLSVVSSASRWSSAALAIFFYLHGAFFYLLFRSTRLPNSRSNFHLLTREWKGLALGALLCSLLFLVSALASEGMLGWFGSLWAISIAAALWFAAGRADAA